MSNVIVVGGGAAGDDVGSFSLQEMVRMFSCLRRMKSLGKSCSLQEKDAAI